ncbi:MAG: helix-turn-helix domain-containing protein [Desulfobacterales bacterium]|nr:helix-turn-helix domain-containing protein [Desulfobacterales bacterium]
MDEERFSFRWGIPWLDWAYLQVPSFFFERYAQAGLTRMEFLFVLHLARYKFESVRGQSAPSLVTVSREMGYSVRQVQRLRSSLEEKGFLIVGARLGRPSVYSFENLARRLLQLEIASDKNVTPDIYVTPPLTPMSPHP